MDHPHNLEKDILYRGDAETPENFDSYLLAFHQDFPHTEIKLPYNLQRWLPILAILISFIDVVIAIIEAFFI